LAVGVRLWPQLVASAAHLEALTGGFHLGWAVAAGAVRVGGLVAVLSLRPRGGWRQ